METSRRALTIAALAVLVAAGCSGPTVDDGRRGAPETVSSPAATSRPQTSTSPTGPDPSTTFRSTTPPPPTSSRPTTAATPGTTAPGSTGPAEAWPDVGLPSVNDPACADGRPPVLLLHGTFSTAASDFGPLSRGLTAAGRCVFALDYGQWGTAAVADSATVVAAFAERILAATGAPQLDVVGYSQGGLVLRTALRQDGLAPVVRTAALIAPSFHGTSLPGVGDLPGQLCQACNDQLAGSDLLTTLDSGGDLDGEVRYAVLSTERDDIVLPVSSQAPVGPPDRVRSWLVEELCPGLVTDHVALPRTPAAVSWVTATLDEWPAEQAAVTC